MPKFVIREVRSGDLAGIGAVVEQWQENPESTLAPIRKAIAGEEDWKFFVAATPEDRVIGVMGLATSDIEPDLASAGRPAELVSAYVSKASRGAGVGSALADKVEQVAAELGYDRLLIISGSRNRESGYPFWYKRYGEPMRIDADYFAPGAERVVWAKELG